jgi:predicted nucleic acid-binding protein
MARLVFADAQWWIANANPGDQWAFVARRLRRELREVGLVTTDEVLVEVAAAFSGAGPFQRRRASRICYETLADPEVRVYPQTRDSLLDGLARFDRRPDKGYSLVDCISMNVMDELGIREALTADRHFEQEGFVALMRR